MAMAARERRLGLRPIRREFRNEEVYYKSWGELNHPDHFHEILRLIGRDEILG